MNWGKATVVILIIFVLFIGGMTVYMFTRPVDDYDHQYYEKGLTFNHDYDRETQVVKDHARPEIAVANHQMKLTFVQPVKGKITFMRPSDNTLDSTVNFDSNTGNEVNIKLDRFPAGKWQLEMEWQSNHKAYLYHKEIYIK